MENEYQQQQQHQTLEDTLNDPRSLLSHTSRVLAASLIVSSILQLLIDKTYIQSITLTQVHPTTPTDLIHHKRLKGASVAEHLFRQFIDLRKICRHLCLPVVLYCTKRQQTILLVLSTHSFGLFPSPSTSRESKGQVTTHVSPLAPNHFMGNNNISHQQSLCWVVLCRICTKTRAR